MINTLTTDEETSLLSHTETIGPKRTAQLLFMLDAGLRVGELVQLKIQDVVFNNNLLNALNLPASYTKTKKSRYIPMTDRLRLSVQFYLNTRQRKDETTSVQPDSNLWTFCTRIPTTRGIQIYFKSLFWAVLGRKLTPHMLRHTFATKLIKLTNIRVVQEALGHTSIRSTQIYTHPEKADLDLAIGSLVKLK